MELVELGLGDGAAVEGDLCRVARPLHEELLEGELDDGEVVGQLALGRRVQDAL